MSIAASYLEDASGHRGTADRVVIPADEAELIALLQQATAARIPVTVLGAGTGVAGGRCAEGGWALSLEKFRRLEVHPGYAIVGAGILLRELQAAATQAGQFYAPDPTENASAVSGNIACNASGSRSFLYGDTRRHVRALRVALIDGTILQLQRGQKPPFELPAVPMPRSKKHSAGYWLKPDMDYLDLFIGSEGTLGVILEAEVVLLPAPAELLTGVVFFASDADALRAVTEWRGVPNLRMLEYVDAPSLALLRPKFDGIPARAQAALLIEQEVADLDGPELEEWIDRLDAVSAFGEESWFAANAADRERFRRFRHALPEAVNDIVRRQGFTKLGSDFAVPFEHNAAMLAFYRQRLEAEFPNQYVIFGHIGDAHVHVNILPSTQEQFDRGKQLMTEFAAKAVTFGGTVGAEHGLGKRKAHLLALQYSYEQLEQMKGVKRRLDPHWLLGRGTLFPYPA